MAQLTPDRSTLVNSRRRAAHLEISQWLFLLAPLAFLEAMAWTHRWVADDAMIDVRVVNNILTGHGPVFNVGERVEAYTNPLWVLTLAIAHGIVSAVSVEWWAVILGLTLTGVGSFVGALATARFARPRAVGLVVPLGVVLVSVVDSMWDFSTSGLETGMVFGWIGLSWWLVVRQMSMPRRALLSAMAIGLGPEIRPDVGLIACGFLCALVMIEVKRNQSTRWGSVRQISKCVGAFLVFPVMFEAFRVVYFGLLLPNTALAKSAFSLNPIQGWTYFIDFVQPNLLWLPLAVVSIMTGRRLRSWWVSGSRLEVLVLVSIATGAFANGGYVVLIGGDFMHARMLLPSYFCLAMLSWLDIRSQGSLGAVSRSLVPLVAVLGWSILSAGYLRYTTPAVGSNGIANERSYYVEESGNPHPVDLNSYSALAWYQQGERDYLRARELMGDRRRVFVDGEFANERFVSSGLAVRSRLPEDVFVATENIGVWGAVAGTNVYMFDELNLANPVGSHFSNIPQLRPGHSDFIPATWMLARFGEPGEENGLGAQDAARVERERRALLCQPLSGYLQSIDSPLSFGQLIDNVEHAVTWTFMRVPAVPTRAYVRLCRK